MSKNTTTKEPKFALPKLGDKYFYGLGRRKSAIAQVRIYQGGEGKIFVNGKDIEEFFVAKELQRIVKEALVLTSHLDTMNVSIYVKGGGVNGQAVASRLGISRALLLMDSELRKVLKKEGFLTRDPRVKERKKPGLKKARRAPQWKKR